MDIQLDVYKAEAELLSQELDLSRASEFLARLSRAEEFALTATPTRTNLEIAEKMIEDLNVDLGGQVITYDKGSFARRMHDLDEEGLKEVGGRIYSAISRIIRRIVDLLRSIFSSETRKVSNQQRQQATARDVNEEKFHNSDALMDELNLTDGAPIDNDTLEMINNGDRTLMVYGDSKTNSIRAIRSEVLKNNVILGHQVKALGNSPVGFFFNLANSPAESLPMSRRYVDNLRAIAGLGVNNDLFSMLRDIVSTRTEDDLIKVLKRIEEEKTDFIENAKEMYKKITTGRGGIQLGVGTVLMSPGHKVANVQVVGGNYQPTEKRGGKIKGTFSYDQLIELSAIYSDVRDVQQKLKEIVDAYATELDFYGKGKAVVIEEAVKNLQQLEFSPHLKQGHKTVQAIPTKAHEIINREMNCFRAAYRAAGDLADLIHTVVTELESFREFRPTGSAS